VVATFPPYEHLEDEAKEQVERSYYENKIKAYIEGREVMDFVPQEPYLTNDIFLYYPEYSGTPYGAWYLLGDWKHDGIPELLAIVKCNNEHYKKDYYAWWDTYGGNHWRGEVEYGTTVVKERIIEFRSDDDRVRKVPYILKGDILILSIDGNDYEYKHRGRLNPKIEILEIRESE
jgi:hypothetical protein